MQPYPPPAQHGTQPRWIVATLASVVLSGLVTLLGAVCGLFSLMFFDDPSAPGAYTALVGMLLFAASCVATLAVPLVFWLWGRRAEDAGRRLLLCSTGYLVPVLFGVVQFGLIMH
ncbi:MAG TPA: hypothetical protein VH008_08880 [Pseudonocardia sp.]|jgi:hypothetical protein|nr:hypothetical protein [Pseudonocardia sp.]